MWLEPGHILGLHDVGRLITREDVGYWLPRGSEELRGAEADAVGSTARWWRIGGTK